MIENITVIGAGTMGLGIGHVAALAGYDVTLNDISMDILNQAMDAIKKNMEKGIERGKLDKAAMPVPAPSAIIPMVPSSGM